MGLVASPDFPSYSLSVKCSSDVADLIINKEKKSGLAPKLSMAAHTLKINDLEEQCWFGILVGQYIPKAPAEAQVTGSQYAWTSARPEAGDQE